LVTTADRSTGRPAANEAAIFRNDVNDAVAHAVGDKPFTLTVIRPSLPPLTYYLTCWPFSLDAETSRTQSIPAIGQLVPPVCEQPGLQ
jgi:hypothetical protein